MRIRRRPGRPKAAKPLPVPPDPVEHVEVPRVWSAHRRSIRPSMRAAVIARDGMRCYLCGRTVNEANVHLDHVIPVARGGQTAIDNLAVACGPCNLAKGDKLSSKRPPALYGVDCAAAPGPPPEGFSVRPRVSTHRGAVAGSVPGEGRIERWRRPD